MLRVFSFDASFGVSLVNEILKQCILYNAS